MMMMVTMKMRLVREETMGMMKMMVPVRRPKPRQNVSVANQKFAVWIFFIAYDTNISLKGPVLSGQCKSHPENMDGSDNKHYLDNFKTVYQTVSILSGWLKYILNSLNSVGTVSIMFLRFRYCPDGFILSRWFLLPSGRF